MNEIQTQAEGSVLLFNNNNALPIAAGSKMTLLGKTSADNIFKGSSGGSITTEEGGAVSLYQALKNEGYSINDNVYNALKNSTVKRSRGFIGEVGKDFYDDGMKSSFSQYNDVALITLGRFQENSKILLVKAIQTKTMEQMKTEILSTIKVLGCFHFIRKKEKPSNWLKPVDSKDCRSFEYSYHDGSWRIRVTRS